ncbi:MAG: proton-conducting transporter membrane subunit [Coriobacteriia bacterium]|nr:proton-conducting transporter membrane subunit [Coriobacteriia bacterium]
MSANALAIVTLGPLAVGAVLGVLLDAFSTRRAAVVAVLIGFGVSAGMSVSSLAQHSLPTTAWGVLHVGGPFAAVSATVALVGGLAVAGGSSAMVRRDWGGTLAGLMAFAALASIVVAGSRDITLLLIGLETAAACAYALVAAGRGSRAREAAMKYFIQGAIATGLFVFSMAILVGVFIPTGDLEGLVASLATGPAISVATAGLVLMIGALAFKAGAAPFHAWAPDAYESSSPESAAFLAAGPKLGAVTILAVLASFSASGRLELPISAVFALLAVVSVLVGSIAALRQRSYTRMLGYAGVAQIGYALIAISTTHAFMGPIFFTACYALAATGTFLSAAAFRRVDPNWDGSVDGLAGMSRKAPWLSGATAILLISLAGIPPLLGFWAKFAVFVGAIGAAFNAFSAPNQSALGTIYATCAAVGIIGSVVSLGYYGAVLRALYQADRPATAVGSEDSTHAPDGSANDDVDEGGSAASIVVVIVVLIVVLGLLPLLTGIPAIWGLFG